MSIVIKQESLHKFSLCSPLSRIPATFHFAHIDMHNIAILPDAAFFRQQRVGIGGHFARRDPFYHNIGCDAVQVLGVCRCAVGRGDGHRHMKMLLVPKRSYSCKCLLSSFMFHLSYPVLFHCPVLRDSGQRLPCSPSPNCVCRGWNMENRQVSTLGKSNPPVSPPSPSSPPHPADR